MKPEIQSLFPFLFLIDNAVHASLQNPLLFYFKLSASVPFFYLLRAFIFCPNVKYNKTQNKINFTYAFFRHNLGKEFIIPFGNYFILT